MMSGSNATPAGIDRMCKIYFNGTFIAKNNTDIPFSVTYYYGDTTRYIFLFLFGIVSVLSLAGNVLVILTLVQNKHMRTVTNIFLLNLSTSDLVLTVIAIPWIFGSLEFQKFIFGETACYIGGYLTGATFRISSFTIVALSLERYFAICHPLHSRKWQTLSHSYKVIGFCWLFGLVVTVPSLLTIQHFQKCDGSFTCGISNNKWTWSKPYMFFSFVTLLVIPLLIIIVAYSCMAITIRASTKTCANSKQDTRVGNKENNAAHLQCEFPQSIYQTNKKSRTYKWGVIKMLFVVVCEFFLYMTPYAILRAWIILGNNYPKSEVLHSAWLIAYISTCCNPITYCFMSRNFRQGFLSVLSPSCIRQKKSLFQTNVIHIPPCLSELPKT